MAEMGIDVCAIDDVDSGSVSGHIDRYILSERLAVERRTGSTLLQGIQDKSLFTEAIYLSENFALPILIVEGEVPYAYTAFNPQAVRGAMSAMLLQYGMSVLTTPDVDETVHLIAMMARHEQVGIPEISLVPKRKAMDLPDLQRRVIEMLPGCGGVLARDLLQHFGGVRCIVNATEAELCAVRGIGTKKAAQMYRVLNAEYASVDTEKDVEDAIEAAPDLLFGEREVTLLDRQHVMTAEDGTRHVIDLVFVDEGVETLILVELKLGALEAIHETQLRRYLDVARGLADAHQMPLVALYWDRNFDLKGVLATVIECDYEPQSGDVTVSIVERERVLQVLKRLRRG
jgi:ERCC4-type nuclease